MKRILLAAVFFCFAVTMMGQETYDGVALRTDLQTFVKKVKAKGYTIEKQSEGSCELRGEYMMKYAGRITVETDSDSNSILDISGTYEFESEEEAQKAFQDIYETQKGNYRWRQSDMSCMAKSRRFMVVMYFETSTSFIIKLHLNELPPLKTVYCELVGVRKLNGKVKVEIDFGQMNGDYHGVFSQNVMKDNEGNTIEFNSMIDAMNYMGTLGWEFVNAYAITESPGSHVYHWLLKKMIREGDSINENIKTKADFK